MKKSSLILLFLLLVLFLSFFKNNKKTKQYLNRTNKNITVLLFYGRKRNVQILMKYLIPNLRKNGGILDKIKFAVKTKNKYDLNYLDQLIKSNPNEFSKSLFDPSINKYNKHYNLLKDDEYFFKIDDDTLFIQNGTFENMFFEYTEKNHMFLSANVVNHPRLSDVHAFLGAMKPNCNLDSTCVFNKLSFCSQGPVAFNNWWKEVECAKLAHESFFENLKNDNLKVYDFGLWDFHYGGYHRYSINFFLSQGRHVNKISRDYDNTPNAGDDEYIISHLIPKKTKKHTFSLGKALVCHYSYYITLDGLLKKKRILSNYKKISESYFKN
jgi:hypothetical protein